MEPSRGPVRSIPDLRVPRCAPRRRALENAPVSAAGGWPEAVGAPPCRQCETGPTQHTGPRAASPLPSPPLTARTVWTV